MQEVEQYREQLPRVGVGAVVNASFRRAGLRVANPTYMYCDPFHKKEPVSSFHSCG